MIEHIWCTSVNILSSYNHKIILPFLQCHGKFYTPQRLPSKYRKGAFQACFANSYLMARRHQVTYVEGVACHSTGHVALHAWCVDREGLVLDRTWNMANAYFGIPIKASYLHKVILGRKRRQGEAYYGLLDDWEEKWPMIAKHGDQPELWLAGKF